MRLDGRLSYQLPAVTNNRRSKESRVDYSEMVGKQTGSDEDLTATLPLTRP